MSRPDLRHLAAACALGILALLTNAGWSQVQIEQLDREPVSDRPRDEADAGQSEAGPRDAGLVIERNEGWGELLRTAQTDDPRPAAFATVEYVIDRCLEQTADPREAEIFFRYELRARGDRIHASLAELRSNPEIHIDEYTLSVVTPIPAGGTIWVEPQAELFRDCLSSFAFEHDGQTESPRVFCMSGQASYGAADLRIDEQSWQDSACSKNPAAHKDPK